MDTTIVTDTPMTTIEERVKADGYGDAEPILFYRSRDDYGWMSSFKTGYPIWLPHPYTGVMTEYDTREHRYQAMKGENAKAHNYVNKAETANKAKTRGGPGGIELRPGWGDSYGDLCWFVMLETTIAMAWQYGTISLKLSQTDRRPIYEDSPIDDIWGVRYRNDYRGKNLLGRCWVATRNLIRGQFP